MRLLLTGYAIRFNRRHRRHGQLFQNRYKPIVCQKDVYLEELVRYIHLNPLRAKLVPDMAGLDRYKYCGHSVLMGKRICAWQETKYVLSEANERMDRRYELKRRGYGIEKLEGRVLEIYGIDRDELYSKSRQKARADARSVFCYWAVRELGVAGTQMAKRLGMSQPGVAYAVNKGERIVRDENLRMEP